MEIQGARTPCEISQLLGFRGFVTLHFTLQTLCMTVQHVTASATPVSYKAPESATKTSARWVSV